MNTIFVTYDKTTIGEIILGEFEGKLCLLDFTHRGMRKTIDHRIKRFFDANFVKQETTLLVQAKAQLDEFLCGHRKQFDLPLICAGTEFQQTVWQALLKIPYGQTASYKELSLDIGKPKAIRAVANANAANALAIIIPCHRIMGADGTLVGYSGGLAAKKILLSIEASKTQF